MSKKSSPNLKCYLGDFEEAILCLDIVAMLLQWQWRVAKQVRMKRCVSNTGGLVVLFPEKKISR